MPDLSILITPGPYHVVAYGTLLGSSVFQSFIAGPVAYGALPRAQFSSLQQAIFPIYFSFQSALPVFLALTYPGIKSTVGSTPSGIGGFLAENNRYSVLAPIVTIFAINVANLLVLGPATTRIMLERKHQETRDGKKSFDSPPHSKDMMRLNKAFGRMHGASALMNLVSMLVTMWYGVELAARFE
ncbi:hypothetical protein MMC07_001073 [Pseudocyphellaria aurata]|nr:hypothetical protein [Pseudocyphellaria aurata]